MAARHVEDRLLEQPPVAPSPPRSPAPAPTPAADLAPVLARARDRFRLVHSASVSRAVLAGAIPLELLALAFAADSHFARLAAFAVPLLALVTWIALGPAWLALSGESDEDVVRRLSGAAPRVRSELLTAVQLRDALARGENGFSSELANLHISEASRRASNLRLNEAVPDRPLRRANRALGIALLVALAMVCVLPRKIAAGFVALGHTQSETASSESAAEPITYDVELTYDYPAYTGLPSRTVPGTTGEINAPAGTSVRLHTRADRDVERAALAIADGANRNVPLKVDGKRDLSGSLIITKPGSYRFRFVDARGRTVAEGPPIPIAVEVDAPPKVEILSPEREVEVDPRGEVLLRFDAQDDYGLKSVELVYKVGNAKEQHVSLGNLSAPQKRASGDHHWQLADLQLAAGDVVTYRVEARDTDTVNGPKLGKSRDQTLKVFSEAEHHRLALQRVNAIWEEMIGQLARNMGAPDRSAPQSYTRKEKSATNGPAAFLEDAIAAHSVDDEAERLQGSLVSTASDLRKDKSAPKEFATALSNVASTLGPTSRALADARGALERWSHPGSPDAAATRRLKQNAEAQIAELEKDIVYLEKLLDHRRIEDLQVLAKELAARRRDLQSLIEQYQKAPDEKTKAAIENEIARLKERIGDLMRRMSELARSISDEHLNRDALESQEQQQDMLSELDKIQQLLNEGKTDEAMKELQKLSDQMDNLQNGLQKAKGGFNGRQDPELQKQFDKFNEQLEALAKQQRAIEKDARAIKSQSQQDMQKQLAQKGPDFSDKLRKKVAGAKQQLQQAGSQPEMMSQAEKAQQSVESTDQLDRALAAKDYDAAQEAAGEALRRAQSLEGDLKYDSLRAKRFPGLNPGSPEELDKAADQAKAAASQLEEVKKELDGIFPRGPQSLTPEQRQKLSQLEKQEASAQEQARNLQQQMDQINGKQPVFSKPMNDQMKQAAAQMQQSGDAMAQRDPNGASSHAGEAADKLQQLQDGLKQSGSGQSGGGGLILPMAGAGNSQDGDDSEQDGQMSTEREQVELRHDEDNAADYRQDIMNAMKQDAPDRYKDQVKKYYEEIVK